MFYFDPQDKFTKTTILPYNYHQRINEVIYPAAGFRSIFKIQLLMKEDSCENFRPVGILRRFGAIMYDGFLLFAILFFASLLVVIPFGLTFEHPLYPVYVMYVYVVAFLFFGWFWTQGGQTLGMKTWHIQVRGYNGEFISWKQALLRYSSALLFWIPAAAGYSLFTTSFLYKFLLLGLIPIAVDYIACVFDPERRALHDMISRTRLVLLNSKSR